MHCPVKCQIGIGALDKNERDPQGSKYPSLAPPGAVLQDLWAVSWS